MANTTRRPRAHLTDDLDNRLAHLSVDIRRPVGDLLAEGAILLLRWHGRGEGLPEPELPTGAAVTVRGGRVIVRQATVAAPPVSATSSAPPMTTSLVVPSPPVIASPATKSTGFADGILEAAGFLRHVE